MLIPAAHLEWVEWIIKMRLPHRKKPAYAGFFYYYHFMPIVKRSVPPVSFIVA
jgi:hypothetical protein